MKLHFLKLRVQTLSLALVGLLFSATAIAADPAKFPKTKIEIYTGEGGTYCLGVIMKDREACTNLLKSIPPHVPGCSPTQGFTDCMKSGLGISHSNTSSLNAAINDFVYYVNSKIDGVDEPYQLADFPSSLDGYAQVLAKTNIGSTRIFCPKVPTIELDFIGNQGFHNVTSTAHPIRSSYVSLLRKAGSANLCLKKDIQFIVKVLGEEIYSESLNFEYSHNIKTVAARLGAEVFAELTKPKKKASVSLGGIEAHELKKRCNDLVSLEKAPGLISDVIGIKFSSFDDPKIIGVSGVLKENLAALKEGDELIHVGGDTNYWMMNLLKGICDGGSAIGAIKRDGKYMEVVLSAGKAQPIDFNTFDFPSVNPFLADDGYFEPTWAAFFDGDFSKFDNTEKNILLVIAHSAISDRFRYLHYDDAVIKTTKSIKPDAFSCFPYGAKSVDWLTYQNTMDRYGNTYRSEIVNRGTLYFHPAFRNVMLGEWEEQSNKRYSLKPVNFIVETYGCYSPEYRLFYNRMFQMLKGM